MTEAKAIVTADILLAKLIAALNEAAKLPIVAESLPTLDRVQRQVDALHHLSKVARTDLHTQNRIAAARFDCLRQMGTIFDAVLPHAGGRPATPPSAAQTAGAATETVQAGDSYPTLGELGFSRNFSSECQRLAKMPGEDYEEYLSLGQAADDTTEPEYAGYKAGYKPVELTKAGLLAWGAQKAADRSQAQSQRKQAADAVAEATRHAETPPPPIRPSQREAPPEPPPADPLPRRELRADSTKKVLRTAIHPTTPAHEAAAAIDHIRRTDPNLESLDIDTGSSRDQEQRDLIASLRVSNNKWWQRCQDLEKDLAKLGQYEDRDRRRLTAIRELKAENTRLQLQNVRLHQIIREAGIELPTGASEPVVKDESDTLH